MSLNLSCGPLSLDIEPNLGGSVVRFERNGVPILRATPRGDELTALQASAFPMTPFAGRILNGQFSFAGEAVQLPRNFPPEPHAIHGFGWQTGWQIAACDKTTATLRHRYEGDDWPWQYESLQRFGVTHDELRLTMSITNRSDRDMPAGLGWHPYFPRKDANIQADTHTVWRTDDNLVPAPPILVTPHFDLSRTRPVDLLDFDHAFGVGSTVQHLTWPDRTVTMSSDPLFSKLIVFTPPGEDYFCVEPASHAPDAVNSSLPPEQTGLKILKPGKTLSGTIRLTISDA